MEVRLGSHKLRIACPLPPIFTVLIQRLPGEKQFVYLTEYVCSFCYVKFDDYNTFYYLYRV